MKKRAAFLGVGLAVSAFFLWLVLRKVQFAELAAVARSIRWVWVAPNLAIFYVSMYLRTVRWRLFFPAESGISTNRIFGPNMIGYTLNSLFPGRVGEAARAVLVGRRERTSIATALATVLAERVVDGLTILAALGLVFVWVPFGDFSYSYGGFAIDGARLKDVAHKTALFVVLPLAAGIVLMMIRGFRRLLERMLDALWFLPQGLRRFAKRIMESFALGFESLKSPKRIAWIALHSVLIWAMVAWSVQVLAYAFALSMTFMQGLAITMIICVAILIPAAPGYWGLYEVGFLFAARLMNLQGDNATLTAMALLLHLLQYVPVILVGVVCAAAAGTSLSQVARSAGAAAEAIPGSSPAPQ